MTPRAPRSSAADLLKTPRFANFVRVNHQVACCLHVFMNDHHTRPKIQSRSKVSCQVPVYPQVYILSFPLTESRMAIIGTKQPKPTKSAEEIIANVLIGFPPSEKKSVSPYLSLLASLMTPVLRMTQQLPGRSPGQNVFHSEAVDLYLNTCRTTWALNVIRSTQTNQNEPSLAFAVYLIVWTLQIFLVFFLLYHFQRQTSHFS